MQGKRGTWGKESKKFGRWVGKYYYDYGCIERTYFEKKSNIND